MEFMRVIVAAIGVVVACASAHADTMRVGIVIAGEPALQSRVESQVQVWLHEHGYTLVPAPFDADARTTFLNCFVIEDLACARGVLEKRANADSIVFVRAELQAKKDYTLTVYWAAKQHDPVVDKRPCKGCDDAKLRATLGEMLGGMATSTGIGRGRLVLDSNPSGVTVLLDGAEIGITPIERDVEPGEHRIRLVKGGQTIGEKVVTIEAAGRQQLTIPVVIPTDAPAPTRVVVVHEPSSHSRTLPGLLIAVGIGALASGGVLLYYGHKGGPDEPYVYNNATPAGAALSIAGGAGLVTGTILW